MKFAYFINKLCYIVTILAYLSVLISPSFFWPAGFFALAIPALLIINLLFVFLWIRKRRKFFIWSLAMLVLGYPFIKASLGMSFFESEEGFSVLSYNVRVFNLYENDRSRDYTTSEEMINWVASDDADIKCFQEYYNESKKAPFSTTKKIKQSGDSKYYAYVKPTVVNKRGAQFGIAIFSKFPIVGKGSIELREHSTNAAIYVDLKIGNDTVRVYNIHLQSMSFSEGNVFVENDLKNTSKNIARRLKAGFKARTKQLTLVKEHIEQSPYRVILCGDLNDTPYSFTYFQFKSILNNAFENAGRGPGFTYNGSRFFFLRIDNQFYSEGLQPNHFSTLNKQKNSDHFPIKAYYSIEK